MGQLAIKIINEHYPKDSDIRNLMAYIAGNGKWNYKEQVTYIGALGIKKNYEKAASQMIKTQKAFGKNKQRRVYHMIVSFSKEIKDIEIVKRTSKIIAAELFKRYQVFYGIHASTENLHIHFAINAVSYRDGKKWHMNKSEFKRFKEYLIQLNTPIPPK